MYPSFTMGHILKWKWCQVLRKKIATEKRLYQLIINETQEVMVRFKRLGVSRLLITELHKETHTVVRAIQGAFLMHQKPLEPWPRSQTIKEDRQLSEDHDSQPNLLELTTLTTFNSRIWIVATTQISLFSHTQTRKRCTTAMCTLLIFPIQAACQASFLNILTLWEVSMLSHLS